MKLQVAFFSMVDYLGASLTCQSRVIMILLHLHYDLDLEGQIHILLPIVDYVNILYISKSTPYDQQFAL